MNLDAIKSISSVASATVALASLLWGFQQHRAKKRAERELSRIRRRGDAPFLRPCNTAFNLLHRRLGAGQIAGWHAGDGALLCFFRDEVEQKLSNGTDVILVVENTGESARAVRLRLDGKEISIEKEPDFQSAHGLQFLVYPYERAKHGQEQQLTVSFETDNGVQDTHSYIIRHGFRILKRVDPPLPV
jgi:hypothetical protein